MAKWISGQELENQIASGKQKRIRRKYHTDEYYCSKCQYKAYSVFYIHIMNRCPCCRQDIQYKGDIQDAT